MPRSAPIGTFSELGERILFAVKEAVTLTAIDAEDFARQEAPVRKLFEGQRRSLRQLTSREFKAEAAGRRQLGLPTTYKVMTRPGESKPFRGPLYTERERVAKVPTNPYLRERQHRVLQPAMKHREVAIGTRAIRGQQQVTPHPELELTARGRYEMKHGGDVGPQGTRADFTLGGKTYVGGKLKNSIYIERMSSGMGKVSQKIISPVYYSRYVEFGTRHAAAQPYMRPALAKVREKFRQEVVKSIRTGIKRRLVVAEIPAMAEVAPAGLVTAGELVSPMGAEHVITVPKS